MEEGGLREGGTMPLFANKDICFLGGDKGVQEGWKRNVLGDKRP